MTGSGARVTGSGIRVTESGVRVTESGVRVTGSGIRVGLGCRVWYRGGGSIRVTGVVKG